jgi:hypothetical protein
LFLFIDCKSDYWGDRVSLIRYTRVSRNTDIITWTYYNFLNYEKRQNILTSEPKHDWFAKSVGMFQTGVIKTCFILTLICFIRRNSVGYWCRLVSVICRAIVVNPHAGKFSGSLEEIQQDWFSPVSMTVQSG